MIKNFESFLIHSTSDNNSLEDELNLEIEKEYPEIWRDNKAFFKKLNRLFYELPSLSYSSFAKSDHRRGIDYRSEMVSKDIEDCMRDCRITTEEIFSNKELIKKCIDSYSNISGYVDIILWRLDNSYNVGGIDNDWYNVGETFDSSGSSSDDIIVKYRYGYHNTTYGRIFLKRYFGNVEKFMARVAGLLLTNFIVSDNIISPSAIPYLESETFMVHLGDNRFKIYLEDFYYLCLEHRKIDIKNLQDFGQIVINYFDNLGITEENYEIEDDFSFIYLTLSED